MSLRLRLSLALSLLMLLVCASMAWLSYDKSRHEADELLDGQLVMAARLIEAQVHHETLQVPLSSLSKALPQTQVTEVLNRSGQHRYEQVLAFRVWSNTGALLLRCHNTEGLSRPSTLGLAARLWAINPGACSCAPATPETSLPWWRNPKANATGWRWKSPPR